MSRLEEMVTWDLTPSQSTHVRSKQGAPEGVRYEARAPRKPEAYCIRYVEDFRGAITKPAAFPWSPYPPKAGVGDRWPLIARLNSYNKSGRQFGFID